MTADARTHESAASWFLRLHGERCSAEDRAAFHAWRSDPANAAAYAAIEAAWVWSGAVGDSAEIRDLVQQARALPARRRRLWPGVAAAMVAAVALVAAGNWLRPADAPEARFSGVTAPGDAAHNAVYGTGIGERSTVTLGDGSVVFLNTGTRLRVDYSPDARDVVLLQGQALFEVAPDAERPFVVVAGKRRVTAIGTAFDVRLDEERLQVTLIEGRVTVEGRDAGTAAPRRTELEPGQQLVDSETAGVEVREAPVRRVTSWREGKLIFEDEPLAAAVSEMNRYSQTRIRLADPALGRLRVSGVFRTGQSEAFAEALAAYFPIDAESRPAGNEIVLAPR